MFAIVCEATGRAEEMGGFLVMEGRKKKKRERKGEGQHVKAGSVLSESHVHEPGV